MFDQASLAVRNLKHMNYTRSRNGSDDDVRVSSVADYLKEAAVRPFGHIARTEATDPMWQTISVNEHLDINAKSALRVGRPSVLSTLQYA